MAKHKTKTVESAPPDDERLIETKELLARIPLDRSTIWRMVQAGQFPRPLQLTPSRIAWRWSAVVQWLTERERDPIEVRSYAARDSARDKHLASPRRRRAAARRH
jgi:prophage regulatory protein